MELTVTYALKLALLLLTVAACSSGEVVTDNNGNVTKGGKLADSKPLPTPLEQGMKPIFDITKYFMNNILQPDARGPPAVLVQYVSNYIDGLTNAENQDQDLYKTEYLLKQFEDNWQTISMYYLGFLICLLIGILFIIVMPIVGLCFCCCRVCGNCGGDAGQMDPKFAKCKQVTYTIILLLLVTLMLAGVVCAFVTNDLFHTQITDKDRGYISNVNRSLTGVEKYVESTEQDIKTDFVKQVHKGIDDLSAMLNRTGSVVVDQLKDVTEAGVLFNNITVLAGDIPILKAEFEGLKTDVENAKKDANDLSASLSSAKNDIQDSLDGCASQECRAASNKAKNLKVNVDFNPIPNMDDLLNMVNKYSSIEQDIRDAKNDLDQIGIDMTNKMRSEIEDAVKKLDESKAKIDSEMSDFEKRMQNYSSMVGEGKKFLDQVPKDSQYYNISVFVGVGLSCIFLLVVMLLYMGITFGVCGERPYDDARFCNKGVGANFLMAAVGFMFMFSSVLMLITLILFMVGAPLQTEVCRHLETPVNSKFIERMDEYYNIGEFIYDRNSNAKLTIREIIIKCENNSGIYSALKLNNSYDIEAVINKNLNQIEPQIRDLMTELKGRQQYQPINVLPPDLKRKLTQLKSEKGLNTDFTPAINELRKPLTMDLRAYINELRMIGLNSMKLDRAINSLLNLNDNEVPALKQKADRIRMALNSVKRINQFPEHLAEIEGGIARVEENLGQSKQTQSINEAADRAAQKFVDLVTVLAQELTDTVENEIGRCRPLYDSYTIIISATCEDVLNPFNAFWCAYGLCLLLFIPVIIFAVKLAGLYRKTDKYVGKPFETLGGSNVYPGDHIPLDDVRKPPPYNARAHPSSGFDNSTAPPLEYGQGMLDFEMPYAVPARKGLYPSNRDNRPLLDQQM